MNPVVPGAMRKKERDDEEYQRVRTEQSRAPLTGGQS
jgi:hypothetical protein